MAPELPPSRRLAAAPAIDIEDHVDAGRDLVDWLATLAPAAVDACLKSPPGDGPVVLPGLELVEVSLVSDETIARVHGEFLSDPSPTDVITFHHGEILVSLDTARAAAPEAGTSVAAEVLLYMVHGLLHLMGHGDAGEEERIRMHRLQDTIVACLLGADEGDSRSSPRELPGK